MCGRVGACGARRWQRGHRATGRAQREATRTRGRGGSSGSLCFSLLVPSSSLLAAAVVSLACCLRAWLVVLSPRNAFNLCSSSSSSRVPIVSCSSVLLRVCVCSDRSKTSSTNQWPPTTTNNNHRSSTAILLFLPHACASCVAIPSSMASCATPGGQTTRSAAPFTAANASPNRPTNAANAAPSCSKTEARSFPTQPSQQWLMDFKFDAVIDLMDALGKDNVDNCSTIAKPTAPRDHQCASTAVDVGHSIGSLNTNLNAAIVS